MIGQIPERQSGMLIYQAVKGNTHVGVYLEDYSLWLTQASMAELFETTKQSMSVHLKNIIDLKKALEVG